MNAANPTPPLAVRVLIMAGGTGGHVFPGLAVAETLRARGWEIVWLGTAHGLESRLVPQRGIQLEMLKFSGVRGKGWVRKLCLPFNLLRACWQAAAVLRRVRPQVVLGMGGYVAFPGGLIAKLLGYPLVLHEQNAIAGLTNRLLAKIADRILVAFPQALPQAQWTGNPMLATITNIAPPATRFAERRGPLRLLVVGGSLGAAALNDIVPRALALLPVTQRPQVLHQAGNKHLADLQAHYAALGVAAETVAFIDDMAQAYAHADLLICRAGAMTVAEIAAVGVASLLVPFPFAVDDHQTRNAMFLAEHDAAWLMPQATLTPERLRDRLLQVERADLIQMAQQARALGKPGAAGEVAQVCEELTQRN